ncbi:MAG: DUF5777 family beta-barrel protein [Bacteroidota bacterium]|nr:DUF5777 family beta-barrel protein [Bacteroidota bacterium]
MRKLFFLLIITFFCKKSFTQDTTKPKQNSDTTDISKLLEEQLKAEDKNKTQFVTATFKTTRLVNGHTIETTGKGVLDVKISHRFGPIGGAGGGTYNLFGLDVARMRMGFDYGLTNTLMIGVGRSTFKKTYDALVKWKLARQSTGKIKMPVTIDYVFTTAVQTDTSGLQHATVVDLKQHFSKRVTYTHQLIIGRKFSEGLSLQIMPSVVHRNLPLDAGKNDVWALGVGGRQKLSKRTSFNFEYYYQLPKYKVPDTRNSFSIGFDIETGGHVFQVHFTNAQGMTESLFIPATTQSWAKGEISLGFNLSRVFTVGKKHTKTW